LIIVDQTNRIIPVAPVIETLGQKRRLPAIRALDKALHQVPRLPPATVSRQKLMRSEPLGRESRVSVFMNKLRKLGFIDYNGHMEVHSSLLNVVLHDQPQLRKRPSEVE
jgi:hypothetical protein